jgi:hypothetical protein
VPFGQRFINGGGEFWATTDPRIAELFAQVNPAAGPPAIVAFDLPEIALRQMTSARPPAVQDYPPDAYEFLPASFPPLNAVAVNRQVSVVP